MLEEQLSNRADSSGTWSEAQRDAVRQEMARILSHPTFKTSNRCIDLLRYVVKHAKSGVEGDIKERTLGIEVFGREANYDVGADPIVRRIASEVRKRLAQYYQENPDGHTVKIHLNRGSYVPEFEFLSETREESPSGRSSVEKSSVIEQPHSVSPRTARFTETIRQCYSKRWTLAITSAILIAVVVLIWRLNIFASPIQRLWKPLLDANGTAVVCLPDNALSHSKQLQLMLNTPRDKAEGNETPPPATAVFQDLRAANAIVNLMTELHKRAELVPSSAIKYADFQHGPVILIGGMNNPWVEAFLSKLRYRVHFDSVTQEMQIQDALAPSGPKWRVPRKPAASVPPAEDYAILTRFFNEETGQWIVALSGLSFRSTLAAAELVTNPEIARKIPVRVRGRGNFQIVLRTTVMGDEPGPIEIVAFESW